MRAGTPGVAANVDLMAARDFGTCAVCGQTRLMTAEHIPAKTFGNRGPQLVYGFEHVMNRGAPLLPGVAKRGFTYPALCAPCNNMTGGLYVTRTKAFVEQAGTALDRVYRPVGAAVAVTAPEVRTIDFTVEPLAVMKYVVTLMLVTCRSAWSATDHPELRRFVLDREAKGLPDRYRFYAGLLYGPYGRSTGLAHAIDAYTGRTFSIAEVSFPPVAFLMTLDQPRGETTWPGEITHMTGGDYAWKETRTVRVAMMAGFTTSDSMIPGILPSPARDVEARMNAFLEPDA